MVERWSSGSMGTLVWFIRKRFLVAEKMHAVSNYLGQVTIALPLHREKNSFQVKSQKRNHFHVNPNSVTYKTRKCS